MVDTWMMVQDIEVDEIRKRSLCVMKSRGMLHSHTVKEFDISNKGISLSPITRNIENDSMGLKRISKENRNVSTAKRIE
jgi:circadian clock protein KaiC